MGKSDKSYKEEWKKLKELFQYKDIKDEDFECVEKVNAKKKLHKCDKFSNLKEMIELSAKKYGTKPAFKYKTDVAGEFKFITYNQFLQDINSLGTKLINMGLSGKRIAIIGDNRYEWSLAYMAITCGTGIVVPLDKMLPANELETLIVRSGVEAIFYSNKYDDVMQDIRKRQTTDLRYYISMDLEKRENGVYSQKELVKNGKELMEKGNKKFLDAKINNETMGFMLFTSGTTSESKVVALSHKNICENLMDLAKVMDINENDKILSFLPVHHVFECTVGFLFALYKGAQTSFCDGIKHIVPNLKEYEISFACFVPAIYENMYKNIVKKLEKENKLETINMLIEKNKNASMEEKKKIFKDIYNIFGGNIRLFISGAAPLDKKVEEWFRSVGINLCQGYGLTETSPVVALERGEFIRPGSIGTKLPSIEVKIDTPDSDGMGELLVKGPNVMLGYFENEEATKEAMIDGWFHTGDLAVIDNDGYIFIKGRKKSVIVLKNGKNIFPEEMENLVNRIQGVKESFIYGKSIKKDKDDIKIYVKLVIDKEILKLAYNAESDEEIHKILNTKIKEINDKMPPYKAIRGILISEDPLIKTTTGKIKRQEELKTIK